MFDFVFDQWRGKKPTQRENNNFLRRCFLSPTLTVYCRAPTVILQTNSAFLFLRSHDRDKRHIGQTRPELPRRYTNGVIILRQ